LFVCPNWPVVMRLRLSRMIRLVRDSVCQVRLSAKRYRCASIVSNPQADLCSAGFVITRGHACCSNSVLSSRGWVLLDDMIQDSRYDYQMFDRQTRSLVEPQIEYVVVVESKVWVVETHGGRSGAFCPKSQLLTFSGWVKSSRMFQEDKVICVILERRLDSPR